MILPYALKTGLISWEEIPAEAVAEMKQMIMLFYREDEK
jgi:hypothetical protein